ncbi:hypothetical protein WJX74_003027 [Apatococcus lobatus]|uniref:Protein N-terminal glutamine amidohydrolase n=2 Tax=Apatococcus TaxID=904362 RepID=A0AAW1T4B8_9CHLO
MAVNSPALDPEVAAKLQRPLSLAYTAWYCEENIYHLLSQLTLDRRTVGQLYAVFLSNPNRQLPLWCQKSGDDSHNGFICYDYHVIALEICSDKQTLVYDFDSLLPFPAKWDAFAATTIPPLPPSLRLDFARYFHVIEAATFLEGFASDRSHMKWPDGSWKAPPPPHSCISAKDGCNMNLESFISMQPINEQGSTVHGQLMNEEIFIKWVLAGGQS